MKKGDLIPIGGGIEEWFGDGSDGELNTNSNVTFYLSKDDEEIVIKQYKNVTINNYHTITTNKRCRGLIIYSQNDIIINGTIDMSKKGSLCSVNLPPILVGSKEVINKLSNLRGGSGGGREKISPGKGRVCLGGFGAGYSSINGTEIGSGGIGGSGAALYSGTFDRYRTYGYFGAGAGGDARGHGPARGGEGGNALGAGGGSGGNASCDGTSAGSYGGKGGDGEPTGGFILLIAKGNIVIGKTGKLLCNGGNGGDAGRSYYKWWTQGIGVQERDEIDMPGGGGAGGGVVAILHHGSYSNSGSIYVNGGSGGYGSPPGLAGEIGTIFIDKI